MKIFISSYSRMTILFCKEMGNLKIIFGYNDSYRKCN